MRISDWSSDVCSSDLKLGSGVTQQLDRDRQRRSVLPRQRMMEHANRLSGPAPNDLAQCILVFQCKTIDPVPMLGDAARLVHQAIEIEVEYRYRVGHARSPCPRIPDGAASNTTETPWPAGAGGQPSC